MILAALASIVEASLGSGGGGGTPPPASDSIFGSLDRNHYRGSTPIERIRATDDVADTGIGTVLTYAAGTHTWSSIRADINAIPLTTEVTVEFEEGDHEFADEFYMQRGNITFTGADIDNTTLIYTAPKEGIDVFFTLCSTSISRSSGSGYGSHATSGGTTTIASVITTAFALGDHDITFDTVSGMAVDDFILLNKEKGAYFELASLNRISEINGNTVTFMYPVSFNSSDLNAAEPLSSIKVYKVTLLENVTVKDFTMEVYIDPTSLNNYESEDEADLLHCRQNWWVSYAAGPDNTNPAEKAGLSLLTYSHHRCAVFAGLYEPNIYNIRMRNVGSTGMFTNMVLAGYFDNIKIETTYNKGHGGNGYGVEYGRNYYCDYTNLYFTACRHGLSALNVGANAYNIFHFKSSDCNSDFHGGLQQANVIYVEAMVMASLWEMVEKNGYKSSYEIDKEIGRVTFSGFSYRDPGKALTKAANLVVFGSATAFGHGEVADSGDDYKYYDSDGNLLYASNSGGDEYFVCHPDGGVINCGFGDDTVIGGVGDDVVDLGPKFRNTNGAINPQASMNEFHVYAGGGNDTVAAFHEDFDIIRLESNLNGSGITSEALALAACSNSGSDVVIDVGGGNSVTITNQQVSNLTTANFAII